MPLLKNRFKKLIFNILRIYAFTKTYQIRTQISYGNKELNMKYILKKSGTI